jgi:hypothetical protein
MARQIGIGAAVAQEHPEGKINADDIFVTGTHQFSKRPPISAPELVTITAWDAFERVSLSASDHVLWR